jgi:hypothetical protein
MPKKQTEFKIDLPTAPQVGDIIRLKADLAPEFKRDCELAGWPDIDPHAVHVVVRKDKWNPGGGERLFVDGPPFAFRSCDVALAWKTEDERRQMLKSKGWRV